MTSPVEAAIEVVRKSLGRDYLNNRQKEDVEAAHKAFDVIEELLRAQPPPMMRKRL